MKQKRQPKKDHVRPSTQPNGNAGIYIGIVGVLFIVVFGEIIAVSAILVTIGWIAGKIVKRIDKRRASC